MNELHSLSSYTSSSSSSLYGWDYHNNLGVLNADKMSLIMDGSFETSFFSTSSPDQEYSAAAAAADFSSGYLEDALIEFGEHSKRRRLLPSNYTDDDEQSKSSTSIDDLDKGFWNFNPIWNHHQPIENFYCMDQTERICGFSSDEHVSTLGSRMREEPSNILVLSDSKTTEETLILSDSESPNSSSSNSYKELTAMTSSKTIRDTPAGGISDDESGRKKKVIITNSSDNSSSTSRVVVVYPFAMVKAGGREGDVTLNDINERMLMAPTRPVRHPVGDFACRPCVSSLSPYGTTPGLSGKAVVALTRIHTQGRRGTITIIRTKG